MRVGMVGLGKLGMPVAVTMSAAGHDVVGYDVNPDAMRLPEPPYHEDGMEEVLRESDLRFSTLSGVVAHASLIFVAVQTPHEPEFEGITPLPAERRDFDYTHLEQAVAAVSDAIEAHGEPKTIVVISTVLPGTTRRRLLHLCGPNATLVYNPSFIAMGTTIRDFRDPEFVLLGGDEGPVAHFYESITDAPKYRTTIDNAELIKVAYNTFIGLKIAFANTLMEVCHKTDCDVDAVTGGLSLAHRRLLSPAYMSGGMGDGGGCHPRDNIALSWLARELNLSYDLFEAAMEAREAQARWLADLMVAYSGAGVLPLAILGTAYKPQSHLVTGSPALLVRNLLDDEVALYDPYVPEHDDFVLGTPHLYLIGCKHPDFPGWEFPEGSIVIDPWRYIPDREGVRVVRVGEGSRLGVLA